MINQVNFKNYFLKNKWIIIIFSLAFIFSLAYSFYFQIEPAVDARAYDRIGWNLAQGNGYREKTEGPLELDNAIERVGPFYEFFLAGIYKTFGHKYGPVWVAQAVLRLLSVLFIYLTVRLIFSGYEKKENVALLSAAIFGFYPDLIEISAMLMTETSYIFLFCLGLFLFFKYFNKFYFVSTVSLGIIFSLAVMARPPVLFLIPIIFFYFCQKKKFKLLAVFTITIVMVFIPWTVRNYNVYHKIIPFSAAGNYNFWIGNYHGANGEQEAPIEARNYIKEHGIVEINGKAIVEFKKFLFEHPLEFIKLTILRINKYFSIVRPIGFWFYQTGVGQMIVVASSAIASIILFIFGLGGLIKLFKNQDEKARYLIVFTIITPLIIFITVVETRYRFQIYPLLAIFAGYFIVYLWQEKRWWLNKILWISMALIFTNGLIDFILSFDKFKEKIGNF